MRKKLFFILNIMFPVFMGAAIYYYFFPSVSFVKMLDDLFGEPVRIDYICEPGSLSAFIRFYFLDMLWAYALIFALFLVSGSEKKSLRVMVVIALSLIITIETLQLFKCIPGTFDVLDIVVETVAVAIATIMILSYIRRNNK